MVDLNEMALFTQIVEAGGFTPAAKKSGVPLSTLSRKMTHLENRLGVRLIQRSTRHIHLTELGQQYYLQCKRMLEAAMEAESVVQNATNEPSGTLKLATPINMDSQFNSRLLSGYLEKFGKMNVEVHRYSDHIALIENGYDCAIYFGEVPESSNIVRTLGKDELILCASPSYLKKFGTPTTLADLNQHIGLQYDLLPFVYEGEAGSLVLPLPARYSGNDPVMVKHLAIDGVGICYLPRFGLLENVEAGTLLRVLPDWNQQLDISLVYPDKKNFSPKLDSFIDYLLAVIAEGNAPWDYANK